MSDKFSFRGGDTEGVADGDYALSVSGGHVTGLSPAGGAGSGGGGSAGAVCKVAQTTGQNVTNNVFANLIFGRIVHGDALWSAATPDRITFAAAGIYVVTAGWGHAGSSATQDDSIIGISLYDSAGVVLSDRENDNRGRRSYDQSAQASAQFSVTAGQYVVGKVLQVTGATRTTAPQRCWMAVNQIR